MYLFFIYVFICLYLFIDCLFVYIYFIHLVNYLYIHMFVDVYTIMYLYTKICIYIYTLITLYIERDSLLKPPSPAQFCQLLAAELDWLVLSRCISELFVNINTYTWYPPDLCFQWVLRYQDPSHSSLDLSF